MTDYLNKAKECADLKASFEYRDQILKGMLYALISIAETQQKVYTINVNGGVPYGR